MNRRMTDAEVRHCLWLWALCLLGFGLLILVFAVHVPVPVLVGGMLLVVLLTAGSGSEGKSRTTGGVPREESNQAGDQIKKDSVNAVLADSRLTEEQRNAMLKHLLSTPTSVPERDRK